MTKNLSPGEKMQRMADAIETRCRSCVYGRDEGRVVCGYPTHPGVVGGLGSEWVLRCEHYQKRISHKQQDMRSNAEIRGGEAVPLD